MAGLVDTCGWIEWLTDGQLADVFAPYLADPAELIIPTTLQFELYKWAGFRSSATAPALLYLLHPCSRAHAPYLHPCRQSVKKARLRLWKLSL